MPGTLRPTAILLGVALSFAGGCSDVTPPEEGSDEPADSIVLLDLPLDGVLARITGSDIQALVQDLAHDSTLGRANLTPELEGTAAYIAERFQAAGLDPGAEEAGQPSFFHRWPLEIRELMADSLAMRVVDPPTSFDFPTEFYVVHDPRVSEVEAGLFWVGTPAAEDQLSDGDLEGRIALFYNPEDLLTTPWNEFRRDAMDVAVAGGAVAVAYIHNDGVGPAEMEELAWALTEVNGAYPEFGISGPASGRLAQALGLTLTELRNASPQALGAELRVAMPLDVRSGDSPNVVARLPGSDPELSDTHVVLTAHFDHLGVRRPDETGGDSIANGADDNASGVAVLLELADALGSLDPAPPRSVLFLATSGEERGLLGAEAYLETPTVPIEDMVAVLNFDMVGRSEGGVFYPVGGEYSTIGTLVEKVAMAEGGTLQPATHDDEHLYGRSDHYEFAKLEIPALWFFTGFHDDYHSASDHPDLLAYGTAAELARLWLEVVGQVAWREAPPEWTPEGVAALGHLW